MNLSALSKLAKKSASSLKTEPWKSFTLKNGIKVASRDDQTPMCRLAICYESGPRFEATNQLGLSNMLRLMVDQSKVNCTGLNFVRSIQQKGATFGCGVSRESIYYYVDCTRDALDKLAPYLVLAAVHSVFKSWEVSDMMKSLQRDISTHRSNEAALAFEKLHEAAFHTCLGNSLHASPYMTKNMTSENLQNFVSENFFADKTSVIGCGVASEDLERFARLLDLRKNKGKCSTGSFFHSSEVRVPSGSSIGNVVVAIPGVSLGVGDEYWCAGVFRQLLGGSSGVANSSYVATSRLESPILMRQSRFPFLCRGLSLSYSDAGILGYSVTGNSEDMNNLVMGAQREFISVLEGHVTEEEFVRAKRMLKSSMAREESLFGGKFERVLPFVSLGLPITELGQVWGQIDRLEFSTFQNFLKTRERRFAMSAVGGISEVPYLDELTA